jgi:hypothetical protein
MKQSPLRTENRSDICRRFAFVLSAKGAAFNREPGAMPQVFAKYQISALKVRFTFSVIFLRGTFAGLRRAFSAWLPGQLNSWGDAPRLA